MQQRTAIERCMHFQKINAAQNQIYPHETKALKIRYNLKVSKTWKQIVKPWIFPKMNQWIQLYYKAFTTTHFDNGVFSNVAFVLGTEKMPAIPLL